MAKTGNPFLDGDFAGMFDLSKAFEQFDVTKMMSQFNLPMADSGRLVELQQRNMEAITTANRVAMEGVQAMLMRQGEIFRDSFGEATRAMQELTAAGTPDEKMALQTDIVKQAYENGLAHLRELSEMSTKANKEATDVLNARISAALEEMKDFIKS